MYNRKLFKKSFSIIGVIFDIELVQYYLGTDIKLQIRIRVLREQLQFKFDLNIFHFIFSTCFNKLCSLSK